MPTRIVKFLDNMDVLREQSNNGIDAQLKRINIKPLIANPGKSAEAFKKIILDYMFSQSSRQLIARARLEGDKLAKTL